MQRTLVGWIALGMLVAGCAKPENNTVVSPAKTGPALENSLDIPEAVVTDGLKAMGYPFDKKISYEVTGFPGPGQKSTQSVVTTFEVKDSKNLLTFTYDGEPQALPSETYELREDGVFGIAAGGTSIDPPLKAMPANTASGTTWPSKGTMTQGSKIVMDTTLTVVGKESVKVKAGEFSATLTKETGTIKIGDGPAMKVSGMNWYVEGVGAVKRTVTQTDPSGKTSNITIEATSID